MLRKQPRSPGESCGHEQDHEHERHCGQHIQDSSFAGGLCPSSTPLSLVWLCIHLASMLLSLVLSAQALFSLISYQQETPLFLSSLKDILPLASRVHVCLLLFLPSASSFFSSSLPHLKVVCVSLPQQCPQSDSFK